MRQLARWVSILAHPFVMVVLLIAVPAMRQSSSNAVQSVLLVLIAVVVPIAVLMFRQVRRGRWSNVDASNPSERPVLFAVALAACVLTRWVKLSLHVAFAALTATTLVLLGSSVGYTLILVHCWTKSLSDIKTVVDGLGTNVEVVTPQEFVSLIQQNDVH